MPSINKPRIREHTFRGFSINQHPVTCLDKRFLDPVLRQLNRRRTGKNVSAVRSNSTLRDEAPTSSEAVFLHKSNLTNGQLIINVFDKPRAKPNLFELCRGEKRCIGMNVFDKPRAEPNTFGLCRNGKRCMNVNYLFPESIP